MAREITAFQFGPFVLDLKRHELMRGAARVHLSVSQMKLLELFVERAGELVTRNDIAVVLWEQPEAVDVANGINTALNRLRAQLGDDRTSPMYIETVIGLGYRFIAKVESIQAVRETSTAAQAENGPELAIAVSAAILEPHQEQVLPTVLSVPRRWSSLRIVLLIIAGAILAGTCLVLWKHQRIAARVSSTSVVMPIMDGPLRPVTFNDDDNAVTTEAVSPSGKMMAYSDLSGVSVRWLASGAERLLLASTTFHGTRIAWAPDEQSLLLSGSRLDTRTSEVWSISLQRVAPQKLVDDADLAVISPDGRRVAFVRDRKEIWIAAADGQGARKLVSVDEHESIPFVFWLPGGRGVAYERYSLNRVSPSASTQEEDQWTYEVVDADTGRQLAKEEDVRFESAYMLRDGRLFFPINERIGAPRRTRLMIAATDPQTGRFLTAPQKVFTLDGDFATCLTASLSGMEMGVVLQSHKSDVFVGDLNLAGSTLQNVIRITHHSANNYPHAWLPDGSAVLMESNMIGRDAIYQQRLARQTPELLAQVPGRAVMEEVTPDGKWILFVEFSGAPPKAIAIYRVPLRGGKPEEVLTTGPLGEFHCPLHNGGCILREHVGNQLIYFALDPIAGMGKELGRTAWERDLLGDWSVSPDGTTIAAANHDVVHPGVRFITFSSSGPRIRELPIEGFGTILGSVWAADGKGVFVEAKNESAYDLLFADMSGHIKVLREAIHPIWASPSRDGKKIAFPSLIINNNVWLGSVAHM